MVEGWYGDDHLILFDDAEVASASDRYGISQFLPGYRVIGLRGWDDFILKDSKGGTYTVETVPAISKYLSRTLFDQQAQPSGQMTVFRAKSSGT